MAVLPDRVVVTDSATAIATPQTDGPTTDRLYVAAKNSTGTESVFLGGSDVTTSTGYEWAVDDGPISVDLGAGETLYGVIDSDDQTVHVLRTGR